MVFICMDGCRGCPAQIVSLLSIVKRWCMLLHAEELSEFPIKGIDGLFDSIKDVLEKDSRILYRNLGFLLLADTQLSIDSSKAVLDFAVKE
jgi:hypothetical protein